MSARKYKAKRDIPIIVRDIHSTRPIDIVDEILTRFNKKRTPESITMWFNRHPDILKMLEREIERKEVVKEEISEAIFKSKAFRKLKSIENWIKVQKRITPPLKESFINGRVNAAKNFCLGVKPQTDKNTGWSKAKHNRECKKPNSKYRKEDFEKIDLKEHGWIIKHPDRLRVEDVEEYIDLMREFYPMVDNAHQRLALRSFFECNGIYVGKRISGRKHKGAGKQADMYVPPKVLDDILEYIKSKNYEGYVASLFMYKTATRVAATLDARLENIKVEDVYDYDEETGEQLNKIGTIREIRIYDKGREEGGKPWDKVLKDDLFEEIKLISGYPEKSIGPIFSIDENTITELNKEAITKFAPNVVARYELEKFNHFWRHMFGQVMLRRTGWNYAVVANLGGWSVKSLEESYGKPNVQIIRDWGLRLLI